MSDPRHEPIVDHWNALASSYDRAKRKNAGYYGSLLEAVSQQIPTDLRRRVLEVGCGTGQILASLTPQCGVGIDLSDAMIANARSRWSDRDELVFHVDDAAAAASHGRFTAVVSTDLLEHVPDWPAVVRAMVRATEVGGRIVIATPNPHWAAVLWVLEKLRLKMPEGPHRFVHAQQIADVLADEGCRVLDLSTHAIVPARLGGLGPWLSHRCRRVPMLKRMGVIQVIVAEKPPESTR